MMLRTLALATTTLLALGAVSCSGSAPPPAQGAMQIHISSATPSPPGKACTVPAHNSQIGKTAPDAVNPGSRVEDGNSGAYVRCSVKGGGNYVINGTMRNKNVSFEINGTASKSGGTATISSFDPTSAVNMSSVQGTPCKITPIKISAGRIWASYQCDGFADPNSPSDYCQANGYFVFENCDQ